MNRQKVGAGNVGDARALLTLVALLLGLVLCASIYTSTPTSAMAVANPNHFQLMAQRFNDKAPQNDLNGYYLNPQWGWQINNPIKDVNGDGIPDPTSDNFPDSIDPKICQSFDFSDCVGPDPPPDFDKVGPCPMCNLGRRKPQRKLGHVNWRPATYTGIICFHNTSYPDADYTFSLKPKGGAGLTRWNHPNNPDYKGTGKELVPKAIHVEFDSRETVLKFQSRTWKEFKAAASPCRWWDFRNSCNKEAAMKLISQRRAVVFGLVGLDSEHNVYSELHPVYAIAIEINPDPSDNKWIVFARNWGNEGNCSSEDHPLLPSTGGTNRLQVVRLLLPPPVGAQISTPPGMIDNEFYSNNSTCPSFGYYKNSAFTEDNEGVLVSFDLRDCEGSDAPCEPMVEGEIRIDWSKSGLIPTGKGGPVVPHCNQCAPTCDQCIARCERCSPSDKTCGLTVDEDREESERYPDPTPLQAIQLLGLLAEEQSTARTSFRSTCPPGEFGMARIGPDEQRLFMESQSSPTASRATMMGIENSQRIQSHYQRISRIIFP